MLSVVTLPTPDVTTSPRCLEHRRKLARCDECMLELVAGARSRRAA